MGRLIKQLAMLLCLATASAFAVQDPAVSLKALQVKEQNAIKQIETIASKLASQTISQQERTRLEQDHLKAKQGLNEVRASIKMSNRVSENALVDFAGE